MHPDLSGKTHGARQIGETKSLHIHSPQKKRWTTSLAVYACHRSNQSVIILLIATSTLKMSINRPIVRDQEPGAAEESVVALSAEASLICFESA